MSVPREASMQHSAQRAHELNLLQASQQQAETPGICITACDTTALDTNP